MTVIGLAPNLRLRSLASCGLFSRRMKFLAREYEQLAQPFPKGSINTYGVSLERREKVYLHS
jgi:hypothetical protein